MGQGAASVSLARSDEPKDVPRSGWAKARERLAWYLVAPSLLVVILVALYPLVQTIRLSFTNARFGSPRPESYVGFENYVRLINDNVFISAFGHTIVFTVASVAIETVLGIVIALVINSQFAGRGIIRTSMLIPWAIPTVVSSQLWRFMYNDVNGVFNDIVVNKLHILDDKVAWIANATTALPAIIAVDVWKTTPFMALLLLAGLQIIPGDVYEAAKVDGASPWQQFWQITLPLLRPALLVALIFRTLDAFRVFDVVFVMKGTALDTITLAIYARQTMIDEQWLGRGAAASVVIFLAIGLMVIGYTRLVRVEEE
ncbi:MAG: sugar ABC transporter permease [Chloroflexota bacterium]|nr:sugar ABC transporter permease [Chloroflexota bacterium]